MWPSPAGPVSGLCGYCPGQATTAASLLAIILGFFGGELLLLCLKTILKKGDNTRSSVTILKRLSVLLSVKSIVTLVLTGVFAYLAVTGVVGGTDFLTIFLMVISFYFGSQSQKLQNILDGGDDHGDSQ